MFRKLLVKNYILIDSVEINFVDDFNVITGETGAGKSVLISALSLLSGQRAETQVLRQKDQKCTIEAEIELSNDHLKPLFEHYELDFDRLTIIRREILPSGKSRAFINDTPVNLKTLEHCSRALFDIHSQHQNTLIKSDTFRLSVVDQLAETEDLQQAYQTSLEAYNKLKSEINRLKSENKKTREEEEFLTFRFEQLEEANLIAGEQEELESELASLNHAEEIKKALSSAFYIISESENATVSQLLSAENELRKIADFHAKTPEFVERLRSMIIELQDLAPDMESESESVEYNPERIAFIDERLQLLMDLQRKHQVDSVEELITIREELDHKLQNIANFDFELSEKEQALETLLVKLKEQAQALSEQRKSVFPQIEDSVSKMLKGLGMPKAVFKVEHQLLDEFEPSGLDKIIFAFSANVGMPVEDIVKIASGGERSRLMLSIKAMQTNTAMLTSLILDEVDTGVSGEVAGKIADLMISLSKTRQLIVITHLPQIAAKASAHYKVQKYEINGESTATRVVQLNPQERIDEIASLLSGETISEAARNNAKELINF